MARTLHGKLTGRAAALDRLDRIQAMVDDYHDSLEAAKLRLVDARDELKRLDPEGWESWWDNVLPDWVNTPQGWNSAAAAIEGRVEEIKQRELGARHIISGGEVLELDQHFAAAGDDEIAARQAGITVGQINDYAEARLCARYGTQL